MRVNGKYIYYAPDRFHCERCCVNDIAKHYQELNDSTAKELFIKLFTKLKEFIERVCGYDWVTYYLYFTYKYKNNPQIIETFTFLPDFINFKEQMRKILVEKAITAINGCDITDYEKINRIYTTSPKAYSPCAILDFLETTKLKYYRSVFNNRIHNIYIYNGTPLLTYYFESVSLASIRISIEDILGLELNNHDSKMFNRMINDLTSYLKDILENTKRKLITEKLFIQFRILEYPFKLLTYNFFDNDVTIPVFTNDIFNGSITNHIHDQILNLIGAALDYNIKDINNFCMAAAMCFMPENVAKKLIAIRTVGDYEEFPWTTFTEIKRTINTPILFNNQKNYYMDIPLEQLCTASMRKKVKKFQDSGVRCIIVKKATQKLEKKERDILDNIINYSNIQIIVFQNDSVLDNLDKINYIFLDLSKLFLNVDPQLICDYEWARVYLSAYGLHCINKSKGNHDELCTQVSEIFNSKKQDILSIQSEILIGEFTDRFIKEYFVLPEEDEKRRTDRSNEAKKLRREYKKIYNSEDEIAEKITQYFADNIFYATYKEDFLLYANSYIKSKMSEPEAKENGITAEGMMKYLIDQDKNKEKKDRKYDYGEIKAEYTGRSNGYGFRKLSLKQPWQEMFKENEVNKSSENTSEAVSNGAEKMRMFAELLQREIKFNIQ